MVPSECGHKLPRMRPLIHRRSRLVRSEEYIHPSLPITWSLEDERLPQRCSPFRARVVRERQASREDREFCFGGKHVSTSPRQMVNLRFCTSSVLTVAGGRDWQSLCRSNSSSVIVDTPSVSLSMRNEGWKTSGIVDHPEAGRRLGLTIL